MGQAGPHHGQKGGLLHDLMGGGYKSFEVLLGQELHLIQQKDRAAAALFGRFPECDEKVREVLAKDSGIGLPARSLDIRGRAHSLRAS